MALFWLPDSVDIHMFPRISNSQTHYSSHVTDYYLPMASNDLAIAVQLRDGFGGTTNPTVSGQCNAWVILEVEVL